MEIHTYLDNGSYQKFKALAEKRKISEYQLAQEAILIFIDNPELSIQLTQVRKFIVWLKKDLMLKY